MASFADIKRLASDVVGEGPQVKGRYNHVNSTVWIFEKDGNFVVIKKVKSPKQIRHGVIERESEWLSRLDWSRIPKLYRVVGSTLVMSYCGERLCKGNLPKNWHEQMVDIVRGLQERKCRHNDIRPPNLLVLDGRLHLIDFAWATELDKKVPKNWPKDIGGAYRNPGGFDDSYSFERSIELLPR